MARPQRNREKGVAYEREIANTFRDIENNPDIKRGFQYRGTQDAPDVLHPTLNIECKAGKQALTPSIAKAALIQAQDFVTPNPPIAFIKPHRKQPYVAMYLKDLHTLLDLTTNPSQAIVRISQKDFFALWRDVFDTSLAP